MLKNILYLAIFSTFTVVCWIFFSVYHGGTDPQISSGIEARIIPIPPSFDQETTQRIRQRKTIFVNLNQSSSLQKNDSSASAQIIDIPTSTIDASKSATTTPNQ